MVSEHEMTAPPVDEQKCENCGEWRSCRKCYQAKCYGLHFCDECFDLILDGIFKEMNENENDE